MNRRVVIVGGGIAGLAVAEALTSLTVRDDVEVEIREATDLVGGKLRTSPFAGRPAIDEGADAFRGAACRTVPDSLAGSGSATR